MSRGRRARHAKAGSGRPEALAVVLLLLAAGLIGIGLRSQPQPLAESVPSAPAPAPASAGVEGPAAVAEVVGTAARSTPVALRIPAIGVAVSLSALELNADGTVQVPTDFQQPGWFRPGPSPGQAGSAVILGHVDSYQGPAVFFRLRSLQAGDLVEVTLADGAVASFVVGTVATYPKDQFPARQVYGSHGYSGLQLVTCGGTFDSATRSYLSNVVAYTSLVGISPAPAGPATGQS